MEVKPKVQEVIDNWYRNSEHDVIQAWEQDDTWFLAIRHYENQMIHPDRPASIKMDFVRIFPSYRVTGEYHISVDKTVSI